MPAGSIWSIPRRDVALLRRKEQTDAANVVGVDRPVLPRSRRRSCAGHRSSSAPTSVRSSAAFALVSSSPSRRSATSTASTRSHPDHVATGEATLCAVYPDARNPFAFPELFQEVIEPWAVDEVWVQGVGQPRMPIDVTAAVDRKIQALMCHVSQHTDPAAHRDDGSRVDGEHRQAVRTAGRRVGRGVPRRRHPRLTVQSTRRPFRKGNHHA